MGSIRSALIFSLHWKWNASSKDHHPPFSNLLAPFLDRTESGRVGKLEKFPDYVGKIYPFVYGVSCLGVIGSERGGGAGGGVAGWVRTVVNARTARFALISGATFVALGAAMYAL